MSASARILKSLRERQAELVDLGVHRIRTEIPAYRRIEDPAFVADVRRHVDEHHTAMVGSIEAGRPLTPEELAFVRPHVDRRIGRVPLGDFMQAFRLYHEVFWEAVLEAADDRQARDAALGMVAIVLRYINIAAAHAAEVYLEAESLLHAQGERVRRDLLEDLLAGRAPEAGPRLTAARDAGLRWDAPCVLVVARVTAGEGEPDLRSAASALARAAGRPVPPLAVVRQDEIVVVVPAESTPIEAFAAELVGVHERMAAQGTDLAVGVSAVQAELSAVPGAYREAWEAMELMRPAGGVLALATMRAFDYLTMFGRQTAERLVPPAVREFVNEDIADGGVLTTTLLEYVAADLNVRVAADRLFVHVNTAHYRLKRIEERTGCDLRSISDVLDLLIAVRVARRERPQAPRDDGQAARTEARGATV